jgi:DNA-binding transcriptional LysR family regulator
MNLTLIEAFSAVMKTGSTTGAASVLGISQPAISRSLKRLEDTTRLKLFERSGPRLIPTPEAHLLHREILDTYVGLDRLRQTVARIRSAGTGTLRVASSAALGLTFAPKVLRQFLARRPQVSVTFEIANSAIVRNLVSSGTHDIGLCADEIDTSNLVVESFVATRGVCVMRPDHRLAREPKIVPAMLDGERIVSLAPDDTARKRFDRALAEAGARPHIAVETQFAATVCEFAAQGLGLGLTNSLTYLSGPYEAGGLVARPFVPAIPFRALMILPPHRARSRLVDELVQLLAAERDVIAQACEARFGPAGTA